MLTHIERFHPRPTKSRIVSESCSTASRVLRDHHIKASCQHILPLIGRKASQTGYRELHIFMLRLNRLRSFDLAGGSGAHDIRELILGTERHSHSLCRLQENACCLCMCTQQKHVGIIERVAYQLCTDPESRYSERKYETLKGRANGKIDSWSFW